MYNILYVHGFNSNANSNTVRNMREMFPEYNIYSDDFDLLDLSGTQNKIHQLMKNNHINVLMGSSFGAFHVLMCDTDIRRIVINPCMFPSIEIPKLDDSLSQNVIAEMREWESRYKPAPHQIFGIFGKDDELFSYRSEFSKLFGYSQDGIENSILITGHHRLDKQQLESGLMPAFRFLGLAQ